MSTNTNNSTGNMSIAMTPWLHFGNTDYLIFDTWQPSSDGAIAGACVALFLFCILERGLAAFRRTQELRWRLKTIPISGQGNSRSGKEGNVELSKECSIPVPRRLIPPFTPSHDIPRGAIQVIESTFSYTLMLAVMTFNGAYILSIVLGLGVGEVLFGRISRQQEVE